MAKKKPKVTERDAELAGDEKIRKKLLEIFQDIKKGFADQRERSDDILDCHDLYNCKLGERQFYNGRSEIFVPIVRDAVEARKTRFVNQMFPNSGRYIEVVTGEQDPPHALIALLEHYVRSTKLRTQIMPALSVNGDIEGQYTLVCDWSKLEKQIVTRETSPIKVDGLEYPELGEVETISEESVDDEKPLPEVIADSDFLVLPITVDSLEQAIENGGSVTVIRRWSKGKIKQMAEDGLIDEDAAESAREQIGTKDDDSTRDTAKALAEDAGIQTGTGGKFLLVYEVWLKLKVDGKRRICRAYLGGDELVLGCRRNPNWSDRINVISQPVKKIPGVFKGKSLISGGVMDLQVAANDAINQGMDSLAFSLAPLIAVDPEKVSRWQELILDVGAVWPIDPSGMKPFSFPNLTSSAYEVVMRCESRIFQSLSVNPSMIPQQTGGKEKKHSQAEIANAQQVDILTTSDAATNVEDGILTPLMQHYADLDYQHRSKEITVQKFGELGVKADMEKVKPLQNTNRYWIKWFGVESSRNAAQVQQQIAFMGTLMQIPPDKYPGYELNIAPIIVGACENIFGDRRARLIFKDPKEQQTVPPEVENNLFTQGFEVLVHTSDDDGKHMQVHAQAPPSMQRDAHMKRHQLQADLKQKVELMAKVAAAQAAGGQGGGGGRPPQPGAQPAGRKQGKQRPGGIRPDSMPKAGAVPMPRRAG